MITTHEITVSGDEFAPIMGGSAKSVFVDMKQRVKVNDLLYFVTAGSYLTLGPSMATRVLNGRSDDRFKGKFDLVDFRPVAIVDARSMPTTPPAPFIPVAAPATQVKRENSDG